MSSAQAAVAALRSRHASSAQPTSKKLLAVIDVITETITGKDLSPSFVAYFAACLRFLREEDVKEDVDSVSAVMTLMASVAPSLPADHHRSNFTEITGAVCSALEILQPAPGTVGVASALCCLSHTLSHPERTDAASLWKPPFMQLIRASMDPKAKVRAAARDALVRVLQSKAQSLASNQVNEVSKLVLAAPRLTAAAAAKAPAGERTEREDAIVQAVQDCLHFMDALKLVLHMMAEVHVLLVSQSLLKLFDLAQALLSRSAAACLHHLAMGLMSTHAIQSSNVVELLKAALPYLVQSMDHQPACSLMDFAAECMRLLAADDPQAAGQALPLVCTKLAPFIASDSSAVSRSAADALTRVLSSAAPEAAVRSAAAADGLGAATVAVTDLLAPACMHCWAMALPVVAELVKAFEPAGTDTTAPAICALTALCRGSEDAEKYTSAAHSAMGAAIRSHGARRLLQLVPLVATDLALCDTWLLPLMRKNVSGDELAVWKDVLLPFARSMGNLAAAARKAGQSAQEVKLCALESQAWAALPAFCSWARDLTTTLPSLTPTLGVAFQRRPDLHPQLTAALRRICDQTAAALRVHDEQDGAGFDARDAGAAEPDADALSEGGCSAAMSAGGRSGVSTQGRDGPEAWEDSVPEWLGIEEARTRRDCVRESAGKWLAELLNRFVVMADRAATGPVGATVAALAVVGGVKVVAPLYKGALEKLVAALETVKESGTRAAQSNVQELTNFMDAARALAPGLPDSAVTPLLKASLVAAKLASPALQKHSWKVVAYVVVARPQLLRQHFADIMAAILDTAAVNAAAKRHHLACVMPVAMLLESAEGAELAETVPGGLGDDGAQGLVAGLVAEVVLATKEVNNKTRTQAYALLVRLAHAMHDLHPPEEVPDEEMETDAEDGRALINGGLERLFSMILAGLASPNARMVSSCVMALARLVFEFAHGLQGIAVRLVPPVCLLLRTKARQNVKAVLGFLKVLAMRLPVPVLTAQLGTIVPAALLWAEDTKNRFKLRVRQMLERLAARCGYEAVAAAWPQSDQKLLAAIRKGMSRKIRKRAAQKAEGSNVDGDGDAAQGDRGSGKAGSQLARTARGSEWGHTKVFSHAEESAGASESGKKSRGLRSAHKGSVHAKLAGDDDDPADLLDLRTSRALARSAAGKPSEEDTHEEFRKDEQGKMVIAEEDDGDLGGKKGKKRRRGGDPMELDDSDLDDMQGVVHDLKGALAKTDGARSLGHAPSVTRSHKSAISSQSAAARRSVGRRSKSDQAAAAAKQFKAKRASGDSKGSGKVEPFAYWQFDRTLLAKSRGKRQRVAKEGMGSVVHAAAPARGRKAGKQ